jgi:hypothetical protein
MGKVQGVKEKLHYPIYDAFFVKDEPDPTDPTKRKPFEKFMTDPRVIRFFVDIQNKTKLETNLQASGVLPSLNTFEARAMRVVVSSLNPLHEPVNKTLIKQAADKYCDEKTKPEALGNLIQAVQPEFTRAIAANAVTASAILTDLIYNSVTTLLVGEKIMVETPTYFFPSGAGVHPGSAGVLNHGEPDPTATFRFAEPIIIEPQQNFRVEMSFPQGVPGGQTSIADPQRLAGITGPLRIWVVLDGYLTRDVQ